MKGGEISGNSAKGISNKARGGGVNVAGNVTFTMEGGRIQGNTDSDSFTQNTVTTGGQGAALFVDSSSVTAKWGTGGTYTNGGASQTGGNDIGTSDDTLIAIPASAP
jgi:hypothetical protein